MCAHAVKNFIRIPIVLIFSNLPNPFPLNYPDSKDPVAYATDNEIETHQVVLLSVLVGVLDQLQVHGHSKEANQQGKEVLRFLKVVIYLTIKSNSFLLFRRYKEDDRVHNQEGNDDTRGKISFKYRLQSTSSHFQHPGRREALLAPRDRA